jgi:hypothetical protein
MGCNGVGMGGGGVQNLSHGTCGWKLLLYVEIGVDTVASRRLKRASCTRRPWTEKSIW